MSQSICIIRLSALGDVLMLVPLIRTLQANSPQVKLTWIISRPAYDLVEGMDGVEFIVIDKPKRLGDYIRFARRMRQRRFDLLFAAQASFRANLLIPLIRARRKIGYDALRAKDGHNWFINEKIAPGNDHTLEGFLKFSEVIGITQKEISWNLPISNEVHQWARDRLPQDHGPLFLINPAASKPERSWPVERYIAVINHVKSHWGGTVVLTGGPGEYDQSLARAIMAEACVDANLVGQTKPKQLLAVIRLGDIMMCPDTGPSHMAASVGTPVIALHAVTSAEVSGPYPFRHLAVDYYPEAVKTILCKTPETLIWGTHAHGQETMKLIPVQSVTDRIDKVLSDLKFNPITDI